MNSNDLLLTLTAALEAAAKKDIDSDPTGILYHYWGGYQDGLGYAIAIVKKANSKLDPVQPTAQGATGEQ